MTKTFVLSDESVNSYGFRVDLSGLKLNRFKSNPVMLYNHRHLVGKWENIRMEGDQLLADAVFMEGKEEELAVQIKNRVDKGFLKGASMGMHIISMGEKKGERVALSAEIFECSVCDIPSNANSMTLYDREGVKLKDDQLAVFLESVQKTKTKTKIGMKLNENSYRILGLETDAGEAAAEQAIQELITERDRLQAVFDKTEEESITALLDDAIREGRILADKREDFKKLAGLDFALAKKTLELLPEKGTIAGTEQRSSTLSASDRTDWTHKKWREKDTAGLLAIKKDDPEQYAEILKKNEN